jgi:hypothetical protein
MVLAPMYRALPACTTSCSASIVSSTGVSVSKRCTWYRSTYSSPSRLSEASIDASTCLRESPRPFGSALVGEYTFVATTISSRRASFRRSVPVTDSLAPPAYMSAVSALGRAADDRLGGVGVEDPCALGGVAEAHHPEPET